MTAPPAFDAVLLLSFGGPEGPDDVLPFLRNVTRGRNVPDERLAVVADQYAQFGGRSPINDQCRSLISALQAELDANDIDLPIYWGNRNWHPFVTETIAAMAADGVQNSLVYVTSAFGSYSGCRQYRQDLEQASTAVGDRAPNLRKLRLFYNHPGFIEPMADNVSAAWADFDPDQPRRCLFTAHSIPISMATASDYESQLREAAGLIAEAADIVDWDLAFQSRSGPPQVPWLEPDINDALTQQQRDGIKQVLVAPLGFLSDHMEVLFDLDTQAKATATTLGIDFRRAPTVGTHPRFVTMLRELIEEQTSDTARLALGASGPWPDECPVGHCTPAPTARGTGNR